MGCDITECGEDEQLCDAGYDMDGNFSLFVNSVQGIFISIVESQVALCQWNANQPNTATSTHTP